MRKLVLAVAILFVGAWITLSIAQTPPSPSPGTPPPAMGPGCPGCPMGGPGAHMNRPGGPGRPGCPMMAAGGPGGPGAPMGDPDDAMGGPGMMNPENHMRMWEQFQRAHPEDAKTLTGMMEKYPELREILGMPGARGGGMRGGPGGGARMERMQQQDPAHFERMRKIMALRQQAKDLGDQYAAATNPQDKKRIEADIRKTLNDLYDLRLTEMKYRVTHVEQKLADVKGELSKYEKDRSGVIDAWFKQITGNEEYKTF